MITPALLVNWVDIARGLDFDHNQSPLTARELKLSEELGSNTNESPQVHRVYFERDFSLQ